MVRVGTTLSEPAAHARRRPLQTRRLTAAECISSVTPMLNSVCEETPDAIDLIDGFAFYLLTDKLSAHCQTRGQAQIGADLRHVKKTPLPFSSKKFPRGPRMATPAWLCAPGGAGR